MYQGVDPDTTHFSYTQQIMFYIVIQFNCLKHKLLCMTKKYCVQITTIYLTTTKTNYEATKSRIEAFLVWKFQNHAVAKPPNLPKSNCNDHMQAFLLQHSESKLQHPHLQIAITSNTWHVNPPPTCNFKSNLHLHGKREKSMVQRFIRHLMKCLCLWKIYRLQYIHILHNIIW